MKLKAIIYLVLLIKTSLPAFCQLVAISNDRQNIFYVGIPNPITVAVEGYKKESIVLSCDQGEISKHGHGSYSIVVQKEGIAIIAVRLKTKGGIKKISEQRFRAIRSPNPNPRFAGKRGGVISIAEIRASPQRLFAILDEFGCSPKYVIDSCDVIVIREKVPFFYGSVHNENGIRLSDNTKVEHILEELKDGDKLLFTGITCVGPDGIRRYLTALEFNVVDSIPAKIDEK